MKDKYTFVELDENTLSPIILENGEYKIVEDINLVDYVGLVLPDDYVAVCFDKNNYNRFYYTSPKDEQEINKYKDYDINQYIRSYIYEESRDNPFFGYIYYNTVNLIFKKTKLLKESGGPYLMTGGFRASICTSPSIVVIKVNPYNNSVKKKHKDETEYVECIDDYVEILDNVPELPYFCLPLYNCVDDINFVNDYVEVSKKQLKRFLNYISFEYPDGPLEKVYAPSCKQDDIMVNKILYDSIDFINYYFLKETLDRDEDYYRLLYYPTKFNGASLELKSFDDVEEEDVSYLWYPYIPLGSIVLLAGDPGVGKSYMALKFASIVSKGDTFPFDNKSIDSKPSNVLLQNGEDSKETIKKRLQKLDANMSNIWFIGEEDSQFKVNNLDLLEKSLYKTRPKLVIIDPITQYLPKISMDRANEVRDALSPLADLASRYQCTFLLVAHKNKNTKTNSLYRILGSIDFIGICRSLLTASVVNSNTYLKQEKNSYSEFGKPVEYKIDENGFEFIQQVDLKELNYSVDKPINEAKNFIIKELENGETPSKEIYNKAKELGISQATLNRAKETLGVGSRKRKDEQGNEYWVWVIKSDIE